MKRCPTCRRDYFDDSLAYCLDDGAALLEGPASGQRALESEQSTRTFQAPSDEPETEFLPDRSFEGKRPRQPAARSYRSIALAGTALAVLAVLGIASYRYWGHQAASGRQISSIAVLPLANLSGDADQQFFADGMTEAIIGNLSKIGSIKVISRTSVMRYKGGGKSVPEIAKELGVDAVVEGSVQRSADRIRVTAQLVNAETDSPVWSQNYERPASDILELQNDIAQALATEIRAKLTPADEKRLATSQTLDPQATEAFLLGRHYFHKWTIESERQAVEQFQKAVAIEPSYADAWAGLADAWTVRSMVGDLSAKDVEKPTKDATLKALELDPDNAAAHISMCFVRINYDFAWAEGEESCKRGIQLDPNNPKGHFAYAYLMSRTGRHNEVDTHMQNAMRLDPAEAWWPSVYGSFLIQARRFDEAERQIQRAIVVDPTYLPSYGSLSNLYVEQGKYGEALTAAAKAGGSPTSAWAGYIYARKGDRAKALEILSKTQSNSPYDLLLLYAALGDLDKAFEIANRTLDEGNGFMFGYGNFLILDQLKHDPRWQPLSRRLNLPSS